MAGIFISYRHNDSDKFAVTAIRKELTLHFGADCIFRDSDSIEAGMDFVEEIEQAVGSCAVLIAIIGQHWLMVTDKHGKRRLDDPNDFVRLEIETALNRKVRVIPALVDDASMPAEEDLPSSLKKFYRRQALEISHTRFQTDIDKMIRVLEKIVPKTGSQEHLSSVGSVKPNKSRSVLAKPPDGMALVPKGPFLYGQDRDREDIPNDYYIGICPVTNEQYKEFILCDGYVSKAYWSEEGWKWKEGWKWIRESKIYRPEYWNDADWNQPDHPVVGVSYYEAEAYANWSGKRLPTEQEWEKAARGTDGREYPWGNEFDKTKCNSDESKIKSTTPVTKYYKGVSPFGCFDMAGNVWEWCASWYDEKENLRVIRGGSLLNEPELLRVFSWRRNSTELRNYNIGFRVVQDIR